MKNRVLSLFILACVCYQTANAQNLAWARGFGSSTSDVGTAVATDAAGNVYTTGYFTGSVDFDPGTAFFILASSGGNDIFIQKTDAAGNFVWAKSYGSSLDDRGLSIAVDAAGNVFAAGQFYNTVDFDAGAGIHTLTSLGFNDAFVLKLDVSGNFAWVKQIGGVNHQYAYGITLDAAGNIYTTGQFEDLVDFDPGTGVYNLTTIAPDPDVFIQKLDASGNFIWAKQFESPYGYTDCGNAIAVDASGNVYTAGSFGYNIASSFGTADFDPGAGTYTLTAAGLEDIFISKLDASGNFVWAKQIGGTSHDKASGIAVDGSGNVFVTGLFNATADFDPGTGVTNLTSSAFGDIFILKLDASGGFSWVKQIGGAGDDYGTSIKTDAAGNVYTIGAFALSADFDPGTGVDNHISVGAHDIFIEKLDASGNFIWVDQIGNASDDIGYSIAMTSSGNIYATGYFAATVDFDPGAGITNITSTGIYDVFIAKFAPPPPPTFNVVVSATAVSVCKDSCITFSNLSTCSTPIDSIRWSMPGMTIATPSAPSINICFPASGTFHIILHVYSGMYSDSSDGPIIVNPAPSPTIAQAGTTLSVPALYSSYQWYNGAVLIAGATNNSYTYGTAGTYKVVVDSAGCKGTSLAFNTLGISPVGVDLSGYLLSQTDNTLMIHSVVPLDEINMVTMYDANGRQVLNGLWENGSNAIQLPTGVLPSGLYIIKLTNSHSRTVIKWMKL